MHAYTGILSALLQRGRTGQGSRIDVSMLESMVGWMSYPRYYAVDGATPPPRAGAAHATIRFAKKCSTSHHALLSETRRLLFMPGNRPEHFGKAPASGADTP